MPNDQTPTAQVAAGYREQFPITWRRDLSSDDTALTDLTTVGFGASGLIDTRIARNLELRAFCDTASDVMTCKVVLYDSAGDVIGVPGVFTFTASAADTAGATGQKYPSVPLYVPIGDAESAKVKVISMGALATWDVGCRPW